MDFIILKINGTDVSSFSHEEAVRTFLAAREPIVVEIQRRIVESDPETKILQSNTVSVSVQTDICGIAWRDEDNDCPEIDLEEVTLRKSSSDEKLGLTVCYSSGSELDICTEVYIKDIVPESVADLDGRLRQGDQILQVNGKDVANKEETECLFAENRKTVTLLVSRCYSKNDDYTEPIDADVDIPSGTTVTYQNTVIEQIIQRQAEPQQLNENESFPKIPSHCIRDKLNLTNSIVRSKLDSISHEISELNDRMQNIQLTKFDKRREPATTLGQESDLEHIYETIPEPADVDIEPIYCCPYEENSVEQWLITQKNCWCPHTHEIQKELSTKQKNITKSSKSNSSGEEHENSSSAYNTGGSSNSNHLTFELACNLDTQQKNIYKSTLVLCPYFQTEKETKTLNCDTCKNQKLEKSETYSTKSLSSIKSGLVANHIISDTMYTNVANLQQTMLLQQQLFRQTLEQYGSTVSNINTDNQEASFTQRSNPTTLSAKMEWKVKRRPDGTRYIARRPVRNRILKDRALRISEERSGLTTEDDTFSGLKIGRYWTKEERKKHLEKSKARKQRQEILQVSRCVEENNEICIHKQTHCMNSKKAINNTDNMTKRHKIKKIQKDSYDNLAAVQDVLLHGSKIVPNQNSKMIGLLSVTTV